MDRLPELELNRLNEVSLHVHEVMEDEAYTVSNALAENGSFRRTRRPASELERAVLQQAVRAAAGHAGMSVDDTGTGTDLISHDGQTQRRYRLKKVSKSRDGAYGAVCGAGSSLLKAECEDGLWAEVPYLLGFCMGDDHLLTDLLVAEILGHDDTASGPVKLLLGPPHLLWSPRPPAQSFVSSDESLDDEMDDDEGLEGVG